MKDKYNLSKRESTFLLRKTMVEMIYSISRLENVKTTFPQTQTIINGMSASGVSIDDVLVIVNLKNAHKHVLGFLENNSDKYRTVGESILPLACKINSFVSYNESLEWGVLRKGNVGIHGVNYQPSIPNEMDVLVDINAIFSLEETKTYKILKYMYWAMRSQLFWDGNKRTAMLTANALLSVNGLGVLVIKEDLLDEWNKLLTEFYNSGNDEEIINWTYENCIYGIDYN